MAIQVDDGPRLPQLQTSERLLRAREVYEGRLQISRSSFYALVRAGEFARPVQITKQRVGWRQSDVDAFIASRPEAAKSLGS